MEIGHTLDFQRFFKIVFINANLIAYFNIIRSVPFFVRKVRPLENGLADSGERRTSGKTTSSDFCQTGRQKNECFINWTVNTWMIYLCCFGWSVHCLGVSIEREFVIDRFEGFELRLRIVSQCIMSYRVWMWWCWKMFVWRKAVALCVMVYEKNNNIIEFPFTFSVFLDCLSSIADFT